ncbi:SDR family oxidoreductase [Labilibaculum sp. K2S]|uniref:SDR family oxidoreductase n=1 Tax=Labilibaculum sp. K2S TaxID=3056386 RepID=UPI0025A3661E|nr:SDR family oxidoreductase [Labilibaculum sp. K2S]MDM8159601.1 SDR family oxidoreductase [Labilibaculum sp. K2S]
MTKVKQNVLVAGANGTTGRIVINLLVKSETYRPIAMVRKQDQKEYFEKENVTTVLADLEEDLSDAVKNAHKVIFAAGSKGKNVLGVDQEGAKRLIDAAKDERAGKFVILSAMGADDPSRNKDLQAYLEAKKNADDYLCASGLDYSIVRPGHLTDEDGSGKIQLEKRFENSGKISRADVAKTLVDVLEDGVMQNQFFEILAGDMSIEKAVRTV